MTIATTPPPPSSPLPTPAEIHAAADVARSRLAEYDRALPWRQMQLARDFLKSSWETPNASLRDVVEGLELLSVVSQKQQLDVKIAALKAENVAIEATLPALEAEEQRAGLHRGHIADVADDYAKAEEARSAALAARLSISRNTDSIRDANEVQARLARSHPRAFQG